MTQNKTYKEVDLRYYIKELQCITSINMNKGEILSRIATFQFKLSKIVPY